jgi:hypothetical protein
MAVAVYCFTVVVPLSSIERGYPGGLMAWFQETGGADGKRIWFDDKLVAFCYYDPSLSYNGVRAWVDLGFAGNTKGKCIEEALLCAQVDMQLGVLSADVDWLEFNSAQPSAWIKGTSPGRIVGPKEILERLGL